MSNKKQTAVEWLENRLIESGISLLSEEIEFIQQAKEMEKLPIIDAWHNGYNNQSPMIDEDNCGEAYYKENYEQ